MTKSAFILLFYEGNCVANDLGW